MDSNINRLSLAIPDADLKAIQGAVQLLQDKLLPHLITLTPGDRRELPKMGDKTVAFVRKATDYALADPQLRPAYLDVEELGRDLEAVDTLGGLHRALSQVVDGLDDSMLAAGSEAYTAALSYYQSVRGAARSRIQGAQAIADDLGQRFPGRPRNGAPQA